MPMHPSKVLSSLHLLMHLCAPRYTFASANSPLTPGARASTFTPALSPILPISCLPPPTPSQSDSPGCTHLLLEHLADADVSFSPCSTYRSADA
ncbi:hypothetical protein CALCODRAFT_490679 [Calocera cornea HHB12733]|uniref:Secreted protein n=1 Tax=Calocera cornea HHB12733 TaxID=1353952 RepID=A0A165JFQ8_9BASI|nr:hypothetical protein CALCODRAFT_490679 [Calocera cornea HHB12733]